jgi:ABC-type multidrug transport system fused ATPase/permease subunit
MISKFVFFHSFRQVLIDGEPVKDLNVGWLRDHIGIVSQEPILFATTIEENIRFGKDGSTIQEVQQAAKNANAHDFVTKLPDVRDHQHRKLSCRGLITT